MKRLILAIVLLISACSWPLKPDAIITEKIVHIDARALQPCVELSPIPETASFEDLLSTSFANMEIYSDCKARHAISIEMLKKFSNYKEPTK